MKENSISQWLIHHYRSIRLDATGIAPDFFPEHIHRFRVETKKIRAVLGFLGNNKDYRLPRQFRKLYSAAGAIRDCQVQIQTVAAEAGATLPSFCIWLGYRMAEATRSWKPRKIEQALMALKDSLRKVNNTKVSEEDYWNWYNDFTLWLQRYLNGAVSDEMLLEVRKHAKNMQYVTAFCGRLFDDSRQEYILIEQQLHQLATLAGDFNDKVNLLLMAKKCRSEYGKLCTEEEAGHLANALRDWDAQKIRMGDELVLAIQGLLRFKGPKRAKQLISENALA